MQVGMAQIQRNVDGRLTADQNTVSTFAWAVRVAFSPLAAFLDCNLSCTSPYQCVSHAWLHRRTSFSHPPC